MVGEVNLGDLPAIASFYGHGDELHMVFNFLPLHAPWTKAAWQDMIERVGGELPAGAWPTWVLSNHDVSRVRTRLGMEQAARAAAVVLTTQRGTPFVYQGDELGLKDAIVPNERRVDPGGRDGCRAPLPWEPGHCHGWPAAHGCRGLPTRIRETRHHSGRTDGRCSTSTATCSRRAERRPRCAAARCACVTRPNTCSPTNAPQARIAASCWSTSATSRSTCRCPSHGGSRWSAPSSRAPGRYRRTARRCFNLRPRRLGYVPIGAPPRTVARPPTGAVKEQSRSTAQPRRYAISRCGHTLGVVDYEEETP